MDPKAKSSPSHAPEAEVRHATVVKCDVVGSTRVKRGLDLDGQLLFKQVLENVVSEVAHRNAGYIERFEGDGALIMFGYPTAMEDAAEAGVRTALELVDAVEAIRELPDVQLQVRVGVASGHIAVVTHPGIEERADRGNHHRPRRAVARAGGAGSHRDRGRDPADAGGS